jgi:hypothetical protein
MSLPGSRLAMLHHYHLHMRRIRWAPNLRKAVLVMQSSDRIGNTIF